MLWATFVVENRDGSSKKHLSGKMDFEVYWRPLRLVERTLNRAYHSACACQKMYSEGGLEYLY